MNIRASSALSALVATLLVTLATGLQAQVLVDTRFDQTQKNGELLTVQDRTVSPATLPLRAPTRVSVRPPGVSFLPGTVPFGPLSQPYGVAAVAAGTDVSKPGSGVELQWDLRGLLDKSGSYAVTCTIVPGQENVDGLHLMMVPAWEDGSWAWSNRPMRLVVKDGKVGGDDTPPASHEPLLPHVPVKLGLEYDLDAESWTATVNGKTLVSATPHKAWQPGSGLMLGGVFLRSPARNFAVTDVKMEKLARSSTRSKERQAADKLPRIAWIGDSITQGFGVGNAEKLAPPGVLRTLLEDQAVVGNFGVSATTMLKGGNFPYWRQWAWERAQAFQPNIAIIMLGTNDSKAENFAKSAEIAGDIGAMIKTLQALPSKPKVMVVLPVPVMKTAFGITEENLAQLRPLLAQGAREAGALVVESAAPFEGKAAWFPDGVHPNPAGAAAIAALVKENLPKLQALP